ncbi:hypothetical protein C4D60_Mb08t05860 [Musa balbisiana]|uniref:Uncharacterized protein n=1 Tax=Musa balbisiana TaxID=52838 RepID=A0A4S8K1N0_MUSBA|nr:hypothetical protein C4D60_Mb08t05860 [Musa balbisiana]
MAQPRTNTTVFVGIGTVKSFFRERENEKGKRKAPPVQRKPLKHRNYELDLESRLGKTQVVTPIAPLSQQVSNEVNIQSMNLYFAGWILLFSLSESSRHVYEGGEGNSSQVQERFEMLKKRKAPESFSEQDLDEGLRKQQEEEEERLRRERRRRKRRLHKKKQRMSTRCGGYDGIWRFPVIKEVIYEQ